RLAATATWSNWAGNVVAAPRAVVRPASIDALRRAVREAAARGETIRVAGAGHSFAPLCRTDGLLLDLSLLSGAEQVNSETGDATVLAGTRLHDLGGPLLAAGRALANQGDIDRQAVAGAVATGTHGTGRKHGSFAAMVRSVELCTPEGDLVTIDGRTPERLRAASLSLGLFGVMTRLTLATVPAYKLRGRTRALPFDACLDGFLAEETARRTAEFWWLPAHDRCVLKTFDDTDAPVDRPETPEYPPGTLERYLKPDAVDWSWRMYPSIRTTPFVEMEYTLPLANGPAAMRELRHKMRTTHPDCTWAVEYRTQPGEASLLSPTQGAESVTISVHQAAELPWEAFFRDAEAIFLAGGGRPHWGKLHFLDTNAIAGRYPALDDFRAVQREFDPHRAFVNDYVQRLGLAASPADSASDEGEKAL
ncbi:MAG TPA: D-arabinono-1,4-lactone oxidase, partial [Thermomicrobiales bacterium]|nr:D-arabinono-1,4-lactone oxidase [Thermomicrobiales bacterium]